MSVYPPRYALIDVLPLDLEVAHAFINSLNADDLSLFPTLSASQMTKGGLLSRDHS